MSQRPSFSGANLWLRTSSCSYITFFWEVGGRICAPATVKTLHSAKHTKNAKKTENPLHGSTSFAAVLRRATHQMTGLGQSLRDLHSLMTGRNVWVNLPGSDSSGVRRGGAEVSSIRSWSPWDNLRQSL